MKNKTIIGLRVLSCLYALGGFFAVATFENFMPLFLFDGVLLNQAMYYVNLFLGVTGIVGGIGMLKVKEWARITVIMVAVFNLFIMTPPLLRSYAVHAREVLYFFKAMLLIGVTFYTTTIFFLGHFRTKQLFKNKTTQGNQK